jgi:EAL domain-containing protein (putative c-di-GMP-specific phosphodiesterase class I)/GGDEF domain-containing protein
MLAAVNFHISFYIVAILLGMTCLVYTLIQQRIARLQNRFFLIMVSIVIINGISAIVCAVAGIYRFRFETAVILMKVSMFSYFLIHTMLSSILLFYVCCVAGIMEQFSVKKKLLYCIPFAVTELLVVTNPITHFVYSYTASGEFVRNWGDQLLYIASMLLLGMSIACLCRFWGAITNKRRLMLLYFFVVATSGIVIQLINPNIKSELLGESLALLGLMLAVENEDERIDADVDTYNRKALHLDLDHYIHAKRKFHVVIINILNSDIIERMTGSANSDIVARLVASYFCTLVPKYHIYRVNPSVFVLLSMEDDAKNMAERIKERFEQSWIYQDIDVTLNAAIMYADVPDELKTQEEVFLMIDSPLPKLSAKKVLHGDALNYLIRRADVERAIQQGMRERHFEVYYQPTYYMDSLKIHGAEALIRLKDPELGFVSPEEFIPIAEQIGMINEIGYYVLREVCAFWHSGIPEKNGMDSINVNLSVIQCMQPGFVRNIMSIVDSYQVPHDRLNFEITESVAASDYHVLNDVIEELKAQGFLFSMDDYGTGYSNMQSFFELDFDIIKIDKSILWAAQKEGTGKAILENSARMILQIGKKILVEGVETKDQIEMLRPLTVDYLQGYYFSKPLPKTEFIELLQAA